MYYKIALKKGYDEAKKDYSISFAYLKKDGEDLGIEVTLNKFEKIMLVESHIINSLHNKKFIPLDTKLEIIANEIEAKTLSELHKKLNEANKKAEKLRRAQ